jgi:hypothetical protein
MRRLNEAGVEYILIGGIAATIHGLAKRRAGRPKDLEMIAQMECLRQEKKMWD